MHTKNDVWRVYQDIVRRVEALYTARTWMMRHLVAYLIGMATMRSTLLMVGPEIHIPLLLAGTAWTAGMMMHLTSYVLYELQERTIAAQASVVAAKAHIATDDHPITMQRDIPPIQFYDEQGRVIPNGRS